jgi:ribosomal protein L11 methyltransferase
MTLFHAVTTVHGEAAATALSEALEVLPTPPTASGIHDRDDGSGLWEIGAYFDERPDPAALAVMAAAHGAPDFSLAPVGSRDWLAQVRAGLTPVEAGRFVVYGSHDRDRIGPGRLRLEIEAALAFGTGHHASTKGCLVLLDRLARRGFEARTVADIGAGTGVLAMAAARLWHGRVMAGDIDPVAVETARANVAANGLAAHVACVTAPGFRHPRLVAGAPYGLVFANILAAPLKTLAPAIAAHQPPGGVAILSGILARQAPGVRSVYAGHGYRWVDSVRIGDWMTLGLGRS